MASSWLFEQNRRDFAARLGEQTAQLLGITALPIDPFFVIQSEQGGILPFGDDFGDAFDGRLEYQAPHFLLFYNTKYDAWTHRGKHHPKVTFTVAHELGHYFLEAHRAYLMKRGKPHGSHTEFVSDNASEREADCFAAGLLMPGYLIKPRVNAGPPIMQALKAARDTFAVSLTSMMVRWVQLSDYPCAMAAIRGDMIEWGFTSEAFKKAGAYKLLREQKVASRSARAFLGADPSLMEFREGRGWGGADQWLEWERGDIDIQEDYVVIPSTRQMLVFLTADEEDVFRGVDDDA